MAGAAVVIVLAGLVLPITLLFAALIFDAFMVAWIAYLFWHDHWRPQIARSLKHSASTVWHWVPHPHVR